MLNCKQFSITREESRYGQVRKEEKEGSEEEDDQEEGEEKEEEVTSNFWSTETPRKGARQRVPFRFSFCLFIFLFSFLLGGNSRNVSVIRQQGDTGTTNVHFNVSKCSARPRRCTHPLQRMERCVHLIAVAGKTEHATRADVEQLQCKFIFGVEGAGKHRQRFPHRRPPFATVCASNFPDD